MPEKKKLIPKALEPVIFLILFFAVAGPMAHIMGAKNMVRTIMATGHDLIINTCFFLMAVCVIAGALSALLIEFGIVAALEKILKIFMKPVFNLPGAAALGGVMTFFSDNPSIIALARNRAFARYFKKYQLVSLTNFGTAFGMGLIVLTYMMSLEGEGFVTAAAVGFCGAVFGAVISTRIMQFLVKPIVGDEPAITEAEIAMMEEEETEQGVYKEENLFTRFLNGILDGGKNGVEVGMAIIPGVVIICTFVMMITFGADEKTGLYTGAAYEGVAWLPKICGYFKHPIYWLFGFESPENIAFPLTAMGAVGSALALVPKLKVNPNDIAVFTSIGMCWSGYLSTHTAMLDALGYRNVISKALISHTIGGLCAGVFAHYVYLLVSTIF
ncbi:hypothetical protein J6X96_02605 [bacterium]|nr:hypothetical protein [bacterium]